MKVVHPFVAAAALLLAGVTTLAATAVVQHRRARARRPPPPPELEEAPPAPRHIYFSGPAPAPRPAAPPAAAPERGELHLHVTGPHRLAVADFEVSVHRVGDDPDLWSLLEGDALDGQAEPPPGTFMASELDPGRYDVRVEAEGMRAVRLDAVPTGPKVLEVALARRPALLGAVGDLGGHGCTGATISWSGPGDDAETGQASVGDDCTFFVEALPEDGPVTVAATRGAVQARALVMPPLAGDAGFLCLAPPCLEQPASLLVYVTDTDHQEVDDATFSWTWQSDLENALGDSQGTGVIFVHGRRAGQTLALRAARGAQVAEATAVLGPGVTEVVLTLPAAASSAASSDRDDSSDDDDDMGGASATFEQKRAIIVH
ncbi:MAG TPA: hypothetical protein VHL80_18115 [Polyangia bacterium]|nr:hypothetical protein [Polyangia bacterium]